jgi:hypothetical protein
MYGRFWNQSDTLSNLSAEVFHRRLDTRFSQNTISNCFSLHFSNLHEDLIALKNTLGKWFLCYIWNPIQEIVRRKTVANVQHFFVNQNEKLLLTFHHNLDVVKIE